MSLPTASEQKYHLPAKRLESIAIELTTRCNLTCPMCRLWKRRIKDPAFERVTSLLREAYALGARRFDPYGTELFSREDTIDILEYASRTGFQEIYVVSNGLLIHRADLLGRLADIPGLVVVVSLDGPRDIHDGLRGKGVFDQAVSSLRQLGCMGIKTSIASIIMRPTIGRLHEVVDLASELNISVISMQPYSRDLAGDDCDHKYFLFRPDEKSMVAQHIENLLKHAKKKGVTIYTENMLKYVASYLVEGSIPFPSRGCLTPSRTMVVDINGNVYPCFATTLNPLGHINGKSLSEISESNERKEFIALALEKKCPGCLMACSDIESYNDKRTRNKFFHVKDWQWVHYFKNNMR